MNVNNTITSERRSGFFRQRTGSFSGTMQADHPVHGNVGHLHYDYSASQRTMTVGTVANTSGGAVGGVGTNLMDAAENLARQRGATMMAANSVAMDAQGFYQRLGYAPNRVQYENAMAVLNDHAQARSMTATWEKPLG